MEPKASIIITTHNRAVMLERAVARAIGAGSAVEVIVVDDASTDETFQLFSERRDIRYIRLEQNIKTAGARNAGLLAASAPYVAFLDDDDLWAPDKLRAQLNAADQTARDWVYTGSVNISDGGITCSRPPLPPEETVA